MHSYITELQLALPESTKLPSHQYGAQGCYLFFEAKLKDIAGYEELHSSVFHSLHRLGNAFHLLQLLEAAVHRHASHRLHQMPPRGAPYPAVTAAAAVSSAWGQGETADESDMVLMAEQLAALAAPLASSASLSARALIASTIALAPLRDAWLAGEGQPGRPSHAELAAADATRAFHRVWSVLGFLFATRPYEAEGRGAGDNATLFGDGVLFAGSFLLHALNQRHRHELLDFGAHVEAVHLADGAPGAPPQSSDPALLAFLQRVALMRRAHERFTAMLEARDAPTVYNVWRLVS